VVGLNVPWAVGLPRAGDPRTAGDRTHDEGEWPPFAVPSLRLWDTRTTWRDLEPARGTRDFSTLDAIVATARAHGTTDLLLVLAGTPTWASTRTTSADAAWVGPGSASPPADLRDWYAFVSTVARRYRGVIGGYEIGNEPNLRTFWNGTWSQWAAYVAVASLAIRQSDPSARVVADVGVVRGMRDVARLGGWATAAMASPWVDVVSVHAYPSVRGRRNASAVLAAAAKALRTMDARDRPLWVTEVNIDGGSAMPAAQQSATVREMTRAVGAAGFDRAYWYAWTALGPANLIQLAPGSPAARTLAEVVGPD